MSSNAVATLGRAVSSTTLNESRSKVLTLYRAYLREAPQTVEKYALDIPVSVAKAKIRESFRANAAVQDKRVIDLLVFKGKQTLDEVRSVWMQKTHIMRFFPELGTQPPQEQKKSFLDKFYAGHD